MHFKSILNLTPDGKILGKELRKYPSIISCSTLIWMDDWPDEGYRDIAILNLDLTDLQQKEEIVKQAIKMHGTTQRTYYEYTRETNHQLHHTPCTFKMLIASFK